mgnify:FL=1
MGAWEGIWKGMEAVEDAKYKGIQLDLQERKQALFEKQFEQAEVDKTIKSFTSGFNTEIPKRSNTNLSNKTMNIYERALIKYLPSSVASKYVATNDPKILDKLISTMQDYEAQNARAGLSTINKEEYAKIWSGDLVNSGMTYETAEDYIFTQAENAGVDVTDKSFKTWKEKAIRKMMVGEAIIEPGIIVADLPMSDVKIIQKDMIDTANTRVSSITESMNTARLSKNEDVVTNPNLTTNGTIPPNITRFFTKLTSRISNLNESQKIAFAAPNIFENKYAAPIYQNNKQLQQFNQSLKVNSMTIDLVGDAITSPDPEDPNKTVINDYSFYKSPTNNPASWIVDYYLVTGQKLIPEGTRIRILDNNNNYFYPPNGMTYE